MTTPQGYQQFCPIALTSEILCNRWTTLILRAFFCGATRFSDIQKSAPNMSSATLSSRLRQLEQAGVITRVPRQASGASEYVLTDSGRALFPVLDEMGNWAQEWLRREIVADENLDPDVLFWELRQLTLLRDDRRKTRRVASFLLDGVPQKKRTYWIVFEPDDIEVCVKDPGHEVDIAITAHIRTLIEIWLGHVSLGAALERGAITLVGSASEIKAFSTWFMLSHFSKVGLKKSSEE